MKRIFILLTIAVLTLFLVGCQDNTVYTVIAPNGAPALAGMYVQEDTDHYSYDIVSGPDALIAAFTSVSHDFIFAPTNLGAKMYAASQDYELIAAISFGNYYLVTETTETFDLSYLSGKDIVVFGQNQTSDIILQYVLDENSIEATYTYVADVATAASTYIADSSKIVMVAEPSLSVLEASHPNIKVIDLQVAYEDITGESSYPQAGVFAKTILSDRAITNFLEALDNSISLVNSDPESAAALAVELNFGFPESVVVSAIPGCHLDFVSAQDVKSSLEDYFNIILEMNPVLIGGALPENDFYYQ